MRLSAILFFVSAFLLCSQASAFPEMVRHGYTNCMACHVSPNGGGVLTEYGRSLSKELLSTWGRKQEENFAYIAKTPEWLSLGGDIRYLDYRQSGGSQTQKLDIFMQKDLEAAVTIKGKVTLDMAAGTYDPQLHNENEFISRRHFILGQLTDELTFRVGRFYPTFGIYIPDHNTVIRSGLGWDQGMESYNAELAWQNERWNFFLTWIYGRPDDPTLYREVGPALSGAYNIGDRFKVGLSYYYGGNPFVTHHYFGPFAILGFTKRITLLSQITEMRSYAYTASYPAWGTVDYQKLDFEFYRGIHAFVTQEFKQTDQKLNVTRADSLGAGIQIFPRPHWDFQAFVQRAYQEGFGRTPEDITAFYAHFYP